VNFSSSIQDQTSATLFLGRRFADWTRVVVIYCLKNDRSKKETQRHSSGGLDTQGRIVQSLTKCS